MIRLYRLAVAGLLLGFLLATAARPAEPAVPDSLLEAGREALMRLDYVGGERIDIHTFPRPRRTVEFLSGESDRFEVSRRGASPTYSIGGS